MLLSYLLCISFQAINLHALHNQHGLYADIYFKTRTMGVGMTREFLYVEPVHFCTYWKCNLFSMQYAYFTSSWNSFHSSELFCPYDIIFYRRSWMLHIIENKLYVLVKIMKEIMKVLMKALMKQCRNDDTTHHHIWRSLLQYQTIMKKCWPRIDRKIGLKAYSKYFVYTNAEGIHKSFFYHPCLLLSPLNSRHFCLHDFKDHVGKRIMSIYLISYSL